RDAPDVPPEHQHRDVHDRVRRLRQISRRLRKPGALRERLVPSPQSPVPSLSDLPCHTSRLHCSPMANQDTQVASKEWVSFPGGELEGRRPRALCPACREALEREAGARLSLRTSHPRTSRPLCFQCYRVDLDRERALQAACDLNTASAARFQSQLPFERVNRGRLEV